MRAFSLSSLAVVVLTFGSGPLRAQDTGTPPDTASADSLDQADDSADWNQPREVRRHGEGNPYLREVRREHDDPSRRGGYWASAGLGMGGEAIADLGAPAPYTASRVRPTISVGFGGNVGQQLRLGFEGFAWFNLTGDGSLETVTGAFLGGRVYPIPNTGLYLHGAAGVGRYGVDLENGDCGCGGGSLVSDVGFAWVVGGGFEVPVGHGIALGPSVDMVRMNVRGPDGYRERVLNLGITLTFDGHD